MRFVLTRRGVFVLAVATSVALGLVPPASAANVQITPSSDFSACAEADLSPYSFSAITGFLAADGVANGLPYQAGTSGNSSGSSLSLCLPAAPGGPIDSGNVTFTFSAVGLNCLNCIRKGAAVATTNCTVVGALFQCQPIVKQAIPIGVE